MYSIRLTGRARKQLQQLDAQTEERIGGAVDALAEWPARNLDITPLRGKYRGFFRLRVGTYRVIFEADTEDKVISIISVLPRERAYR
ncbi:MAG: type II toxin-antitoxin system RelE/ParE family toxin [candidate division WS1 bacterium]|nr:type II toxin-antitoxin system RelE/ParE family toxin [candidate division WS1 bacterium]